MTNNLVVKNNNDASKMLQVFEERVLSTIECYGLPIDNILVPLEERFVVFNNANTVLSKIDDTKKNKSVYFSKFLAATAVGLFDAALNYLWDETISEIRKRAIQYDVSYFYDNATNNEDKKKKLKSVYDIDKLDDNELISGALNIGLISELGFKHLDLIRYMRNWASAAHPNQNQITGLQLISWLETCIKEVISLPLSDSAIEIKKLLANIKTNEITELDSKKITRSFINLTQQQANNLVSGFWGIYIEQNTPPKILQNINYLAPAIWARVDEETRLSFGIKYKKFITNSDKESEKKAKIFLSVVRGLSYLPEDMKIVDIDFAIQNLLDVHRSRDNFYNEPIFSKQLFNIIGNRGGIPAQIRKKVVLGVVEVYLTNGNGVAHIAESNYIKMINNFNQEEALTALLSFLNDKIASKLQFDLCEKKYKELLGLIKGKLLVPAIKELFDEIEKFTGKYDQISYNTEIKQGIKNVEIILGLKF
ncbi:hypothetical protein ACFL23_01345 [Patescibacteria group bacterium]